MPEHVLTTLDWIVICLYGLGMLGVGLYYTLRIKTSEDYLLGGRRMNPVSVGLSLFATLLSAISYLTWPGEVIKYGPMMLMGMISFPFIYWVTGWYLIPRFMHAQVSSAYELLEARLGLSTRLLASFYFLAMRIVWMAVIIYMSAEKVIVPIMKWSPESVLWVSICMGIITLVYTTLGGIRGVVTTDVIQTLILFGSAIATLTIITVRMGGVDEWWPHDWLNTWSKFQFGYDPKARVTVVGAFIAMFSWFVCTAGSDQMAIQRYLSTRNVASARRVQLVSLISNAVVMTLLGILGLALLGYFQQNTNLLPKGWEIQADADKLFPHFIVIGLPSGFTGLVVAGLLAAAMSSLSSGINSSSLVLVKDFIVRFLDITEKQQLRMAKLLSLVIGILVVLLTMVVSQVKGNLLEVTYKTTNLLVAPLFVPFFMVLFIKRASNRGTFLGMIVSAIIAAMISFWEEITGEKGISFLWIIPFSFLAGVVSSYLFSLVLPRQSQDKMEIDKSG